MRTLLLSLGLAWRMLVQNKVRSVLTLLGMIIGVGAVIAIVSLGEGLRVQFKESLSSFGGEVLFLTPKSPKRPGQASGAMRLLKMADLRAIEEQCPTIRSVVPGINWSCTVKYRDRTKQTFVQGVSADFLRSSPNDKLASGRFFTEADVQAANRVLVIGDTTTTDLFKGDNPIDKVVKVDNVAYTIIGKMAKRGGVFQGGPNIDDGFFAPLSTVQKRMLGSDDVFWVTLYLADGATLEQAKEQVGAVMRQRRRIRNVSDDDFQFISPDDFMKIGNQFINVMVGIFGAIAFISLLVGGVGIMNIMLVSVTERTREIGLRMALGAGRSTVLLQFLVEAIVLTLIGGIIGMLAGYGGALGLSLVLKKAISAAWAPSIPLQWVGYSVGVSVLVGVIFGTYPAFKASQLDPVEAMRYE